MRRFREERRRQIRENWRELLPLGVAVIGIALWVALDEDVLRRTVAAFVLGVAVSVLLFGWMMGFDARLLRWRWGAAGEEWTAEELERLGSGWYVFHDVSDGQFSWDHVVVGPTGVYSIDSKNLSEAATVDESGLRAGRLRFDAVRMRGSAVRLKEAVERETRRRVWVQGVFAVWGGLEGGTTERDRVLYAPGPEIVDAIRSQQHRLAESDIELIARAVHAIAGHRGAGH